MNRPRPRRCTLADGRVVTIRPAASSDAAEIVQAFERLSTASRYARFLHHRKSLRADEIERGLNPEPGRAFTLVATVPAEDGFDIVAGAQYLPDGGDSGDGCEFALTVADDWGGVGLGCRLLSALVRRARRDGYACMTGLVLADNQPMLALARKLRFTPTADAADPGTVVVRRSLAVARRRKAADRPRPP